MDDVRNSRASIEELALNPCKMEASWGVGGCSGEKPRLEIGMFQGQQLCFLFVSPGTRLSSSCLPISLETSLSSIVDHSP
uniref:Uncharacterized protein n=1 Tax=Aegilops tauschii subsp. strangulata TaxID=200361 RepID=A0A453LEE6_AEGTS